MECKGSPQEQLVVAKITDKSFTPSNTPQNQHKEEAAYLTNTLTPKLDAPDGLKKTTNKDKEQAAAAGPKPKDATQQVTSTRSKAKVKPKSKPKAAQKTCLDETIRDNDAEEPLVFEHPDGTEYEELNSVEKSEFRT